MKKIFCNFFKDDDGQARSKIYVCFQNLCNCRQPKSTFSAGVHSRLMITLIKQYITDLILTFISS